MSDAERPAFEPTAAPTPLEPGMRFPLRAMLLATAGVALLAAVAGPAYRAAAPEMRLSLLGFWGAILSVIAAYVLLQWWGRTQRLSQAGPIRFALQQPDLDNSSLWKILSTCCLLIFSLLILMISMLSVVTFTLGAAHSPGGVPVFGALSIGATMGFLMAAAIHFLRQPFVDPRPLLLGEQGVIVRRRVLPWERFKRASWHHLLPNWLMLYGSGRTYAAAAPESLRNEVEAFVRTKTRFEKDERKLAPGH